MMKLSTKNYITGGFILNEFSFQDTRQYIFIETFDERDVLSAAQIATKALSLAVQDDALQWVSNMSQILDEALKSLGGLPYILMSLSGTTLTTLTAGPIRIHHFNSKKSMLLNSNHTHKIQNHPDIHSLNEASYDLPEFITEQWALTPGSSMIFVCSSNFHGDREPQDYIRQAIDFDLSSYIGYKWMLVYQLQILAL